MSAKNYVKKDQISHMLLRPAMYIGDISLQNYYEYITIEEEDEEIIKYKMIQKNIETSPGFLRIFIEILSNAIDNYQRSIEGNIPVSYIKVYLDKETGMTSVLNDGDYIPIEINKDEKMYNHTLIFGHLLSGSNFDDDKERQVSGLNGIGSTACNIFSTKFTVNGLDPLNKLTFEQTWTNNMRTVSDPIIEKANGKAFTQVTYYPDFDKFGLKGYTDDIISQYMKYIVDTAILTKVKVYFNDKLIPVNNLVSYSKLFNSPTDEFIQIKHGKSDVVLTPSTEFESITFVNGIFTKLGGTHLDAWTEAIFRPMLEKFNGKKDKPVLNIKDIKQFFRIFIVTTVINPRFDSQSKNKLENPKVDASVKSSDINKIMKWSIINDIQDIIKSKEMIILKKNEKKKKGYVKIEGLDNANFAGTKNASSCSLICCEGLSAKTYAVAGLEKGVYDKNGRDWFGIYSLTGKILNCRNANLPTISKNKVITNIIQALNLQFDMDYTDDKNFKTLSYGKVILLTDADCDGLHISGLLMNFFHYLFPSLLQRHEPYLVSMCTPIVRVFNQKGDILFYDENNFRQFAKEQTKSFKSKYYKGLGTTKTEDVPDTFGEKMVEYTKDENADKSINKVFHKDFADDRKKWLEIYDPYSSKFSLDNGNKLIRMDISSFLNNEVIKFSYDDCKRSIPNLFDGLKESQRKILFGIKKRNLTYNKPSIKVAQLGGYIAEHSNYHHGEQNLYETITKMAHEFPGSNNIPLLYRDGQFGSRLALGHDAASARYIYTKMETLTPLLFREEDDVLLEYIEEDGDRLEPKFYIPILPTVLINGCTAIGTGWSSNIPCFNPIDIIECIKIWLNNDGKIIINDDDNITMSLLPSIKPWYRGFKGEIKQSDNKYITYGLLSKENIKGNIKVNITEVPIGMSIDKFKEFCEDLLVEKDIKALHNKSTPNHVNFTITESEDGVSCNLQNMKLFSYLNITNMVLFNESNKLKKYSIDQIINDFCIVRFDFYKKRKQYLINQIEKDLRHLVNKSRFIKEVIDKQVNVMNVDEDIIIKELQIRNYDVEEGGYDYLLKMPVRVLTTNQIQKLNNDIKNQQSKLDNVKLTSEKQMWINDIDDFEKEYNKWLKNMENVKKNKK